MKQGWEIKKLGDVCNLYQPRTISGEMLVEDGKYLVYGANGIIGRYNEYNHENSEVLLTCRGATCGTINVSEPYSWINGNAMVVQPKNDNIGKIYLQYLLQAVDWGKVITGAAQPQITRQSLSPLDVIIPPREEQERIVAELNCLSGIIERKREQLKQLDALAQSIFYQMFGDPTTNEKGWQVKKWNDVLTITNGKNQKAVENPNGVFPIYGSGGIMGYADKYLCPKNTIVIGRKGNINKPIFVKEPFWNVDTAFGLIADNTHIAPSYLFFYCRIFDFEQLNKAVTIPSLTKSDLLLLEMPCPPIHLQQEFAEKIEAIEKQKELIKKSISETENLFNARMDYYFN